MLSWPCIGEPRYTLCCISECRYKYPHPSALWLGRVGARCLYLGGLTQAGRQALDTSEDPLVGSLRRVPTSSPRMSACHSRAERNC